GGVPEAAGCRASGDYDQLGDARAAAVAGASYAVAAGPDSSRAGSLSELLWARAPRHLAAGVRLFGGVGGGFERGQPAVVHHGVARDSARAPASALRDVRADPHAQRDCGFWARPAFGTAGLEPGGRVSRRRAVSGFLPGHRIRFGSGLR